MDKGSKLGPQVLRLAEGVPEQLAAGPVVAKLYGDWGLASTVGPGTLVIGKCDVNYDAQGQREAGLSPEDAAKRLVADQLPIYRANPAIQLWEGHNEPVWGSVEGMGWYARHEAQRVKSLAAVGLRAVIGNFATGTPRLDLWPAFLSAIKVGLAHGAVLGLHEYGHPFMWWMTGSYQLNPDEDEGDEGWTTLRYRKVYRQHLLPAGLQIPLVMTECGIDALVNPKPPGAPAKQWRELGDYWQDHHDGPIAYTGDRDSYYAAQLAWYDRELRKDPWVVGATVFTWGSWGGEWAKFDVCKTSVAQRLTRHVEENPPEPFDYSSYVSATADTYPATVVLVPRSAGAVWGMAAQLGGFDRGYTVAQGAQDPAELAKSDGVESVRIIAVNPGDIGTGLTAEWYRKHYPSSFDKVAFTALEAETPYELAVRLLPDLEGDVALCQRDYEEDLGEEAGGETISEAGCVLADLGVGLREATGKNVEPPWLNELLVLADHRTNTFSYDDLLDWHGAISLFPSIYDDSRKVNRPYTSSELSTLLSEGWQIVLPRSDFKHYVYLEEVRDDGSLLVVDPWYGDRRTWSTSQVGGIRGAHARAASGPGPEPSPGPLLVGLHDTAGGEYLAEHGVEAACVAHWNVSPEEPQPKPRDFTTLAEKGITVIGRVGAGYGGGPGTAPRPEFAEEWVPAAAQTVVESKKLGPTCWFNEVNNRVEWPGYGSGDVYALTPEYVVELYNALWDLVAGRAPVGPPPIDPYFGPGSNNRDWWRYILKHIKGADALFLHAKTQTNDPDEVWSEEKFADWPLQWQFLHMKTVETSLQDVALVRPEFMELPVWVTEVNPQHKHEINGELGWVPGNVLWVEKAYEYFQWLRGDGWPIQGFCLYRFDDVDPWGLQDDAQILEAIKAHA